MLGPALVAEFPPQHEIALVLIQYYVFVVGTEGESVPKATGGCPRHSLTLPSQGICDENKQGVANCAGRRALFGVISGNVAGRDVGGV